jgi:hypothetical protein
MKPSLVEISDFSKDFIQRVDTDVAIAFAELLCKTIEINPEAIAQCKSIS